MAHGRHAWATTKALVRRRDTVLGTRRLETVLRFRARWAVGLLHDGLRRHLREVVALSSHDSGTVSVIDTKTNSLVTDRTAKALIRGRDMVLGTHRGVRGC